MLRTILLLALGACLGTAAGVAGAEWRFSRRPPPVQVKEPTGCESLVWNWNRIKNDRSDSYGE